MWHTKTFSSVIFGFFKGARNNYTLSLKKSVIESLPQYPDIYNLFDWTDSPFRENYLDKIYDVNYDDLKRTLSTESWLLAHVFHFTFILFYYFLSLSLFSFFYFIFIFNYYLVYLFVYLLSHTCILVFSF